MIIITDDTQTLSWTSERGKLASDGTVNIHNAKHEHGGNAGLVQRRHSEFSDLPFPNCQLASNIFYLPLWRSEHSHAGRAIRHRSRNIWTATVPVKNLPELR